MEIKTYRAQSMQEALDLVRSDLGPKASILRTREVRKGGILRWMRGSTHIEVTASEFVNVPSRLPKRMLPAEPETVAVETESVPAHLEPDYRSQFRDHAKGLYSEDHSLVEQLSASSVAVKQHELPDTLFRVFTDLIEADLSEELARELVEQVRPVAESLNVADPELIKERIATEIEQRIPVGGPIRTIAGKRRLVALVGPTGVGKTTTIAKLAANFRLRDKLRVGLITVDTYRIAAVEQLRTYADIIDLPMEVVSTPREMREAIARMHDLDLVLLDTAGRSPRDEVKIQELKSMLAEADPDEVHLVLSSISSEQHLTTTAEKFAPVGTTGLIITKIDEAVGLGNLLPMLHRSRLPMSYLTHGQNVPDDITDADGRRLAREILGMPT